MCTFNKTWKSYVLSCPTVYRIALHKLELFTLRDKITESNYIVIIFDQLRYKYI